MVARRNFGRWLPVFAGMTVFLLFLHGAVPAFAADPSAFTQIVPDDCYEKGDYPLGSFLDIAQNVMKFVWSISGAFALLMFFFGGILWLVSAGEDKRITQGRDTMVQAATGLIIVLGSWVAINYIVAALRGEPIGTNPATLFSKAWSSYDDGNCLTSYWQRAFPILSAAPRAISTAPAAAAPAAAAAAPAASPPPAAAAAGSTVLCCVKIHSEEVNVMCNNNPDFSIASPVTDHGYGWEKLSIPAAECPSKSLPKFVAACSGTGRQNVWRNERLPGNISCDNQDCPQINSGTGVVTGGCQTVSTPPPQPLPGGGAALTS